MKIYIDHSYRCHTSNEDGAYREFNVPFFEGKSEGFVEGYVYVPEGEQCTTIGGVVVGETFGPWKPYTELAAAQAEYERNQAEMADMQAALALLGVTDVE